MGHGREKRFLQPKMSPAEAVKTLQPNSHTLPLHAWIPAELGVRLGAAGGNMEACFFIEDGDAQIAHFSATIFAPAPHVISS